MAFTYDLGDTIGQLRLELGDKTEGEGVLPLSVNLSDEELTYLHTAEGENVGRTLARASEVIAAAWRNVPTHWRIANEEETQEAVARWTKEAQRLRQLHGYSESDSSAIASYSVSVTQVPFGGS